MKICNTTIDPFLITCKNGSKKELAGVIQPKAWLDAESIVAGKWTIEIQRKVDGVLTSASSLKPPCIRFDLSEATDSLRCTLRDVFDVNPRFPRQPFPGYISFMDPCVVGTEGTFSKEETRTIGKLGECLQIVTDLGFRATWLGEERYECSSWRVPDNQFKRICDLIQGTPAQQSQQV